MNGPARIRSSEEIKKGGRQMEDLLLSYLEPALASPWLYLIVLVLAAVDGF